MTRATPTTPVAIVGAGPVGLALALGLARHGVRSVLLERKDRTSERSKAPGIHVRTLEVLRQWGVEERFLERGVLRRTVVLHDAEAGGRPLLSLDFAPLAGQAQRPGLLVLEQGETERLLLEAVRESGLCDVRFGCEAVELEIGDGAARLTFRTGKGRERLEAKYVVGCDGAGSFVREALGLPFEGITYSLQPILADVEVRDGRDRLSWPRFRNEAGGLTFCVRLRPGLWRIVRIDRDGHGEEPTGRAGEQRGRLAGTAPRQPDDVDAPEVPHAEIRRRVEEVLGEGPFDTLWASRFRIHRRASPRFRVGGVLLAGDAAHVHSPVGGLGMNAGIQDAHNLSWKLAHALEGGEVDRLLASYEVERRAVVVGTISRYTDMLTRGFLQAPPVFRRMLFALMRLAFRARRVEERMLRRTAMIDLHYPSSPLLDPSWRSAGLRLPDPELRSPTGISVRLHSLLPAGPALIRIPGTGSPPPPLPEDLPVRDVIRIGCEGYTDAHGVVRKLLGEEAGWILVRPDAHVAFAMSAGPGARERIRAATLDALGFEGGSGRGRSD